MPERNAVKVARYVLRGDTLSNESVLLYVRHEVANRSCGTLKMPPSMLLDEPTILNKERMGECSEVYYTG